MFKPFVALTSAAGLLLSLLRGSAPAISLLLVLAFQRADRIGSSSCQSVLPSNQLLNLFLTLTQSTATSCFEHTPREPNLSHDMCLMSQNVLHRYGDPCVIPGFWSIPALDSKYAVPAHLPNPPSPPHQPHLYIYQQ
ncbi:hypothetical protein JOB18_029037 [Solea senegalensis]|uniref:Uncharacterized protein n=1 Tax=Solea senegalensis TaxID=28829 RepID=A0AAV6Q6Q7_SOLSE|nr:hypothetical protein JOB18_029037 [Solea senegalensis]